VLTLSFEGLVRRRNVRNELFCDYFEHGDVPGDVVITAAGRDHGALDSVDDIGSRIISGVHLGTALLADKHGVAD
jgi:hypothetical protein